MICRTSRRLALASLTSLGVISCGSAYGDSISGSPSDGGASDAATDASPSATDASDAGADAGGPETSVDATPDVTPSITVDGFVIDDVGGGLAKLVVTVAGHNTFTDNAGHFSVADVKAPYTLTIIDPSVGARVYQGITRSDPIVRLDNPAPTWLSAPVRVQLTDSYTSPQPAGYATKFSEASATLERKGDPWSALDESIWGTDFSSTFQWAGPSQGRVSFFSIQHAVDASGTIATGDFALGSLTGVLLTGGSTVTQSVDLHFSQVPSGTLSGAVHVPNGYVPGIRELGLYSTESPRKEGLLLLTEDANKAGAATFYYAYPAMQNSLLGVVLYVGASSGRYSVGQTLVDPVSPVDITLPQSVSITAPSDKSTGISAGTVLSWSGVAQSCYEVVLAPVPAPPTPVGGVVIYTCATSTTLPDLGDLGDAMKKGASYSFRLRSFAPAHAMDSLVVPAVNLSALDWVSHAFPLVTGSGISFTTAP